jgi:pyruvate dehydrogenase E2 component (dihydrolipoamide acetyltransferase)
MSDALVRMPKLADTLVEGTLGQWLKQVGEPVDQGEPLASIETDKVTTELTSPAAGTLVEILVSEGQTVPIETVIARIGVAAAVAETAPPTPEEPAPTWESPPRGETQAPAPEPTATAATPGATLPTRETPSAGPQRMETVRPGQIAPATDIGPPVPKPTPVAARLLAEHGLAPGQVPSRAGRITKEDVLRHLDRQVRASGPPHPAPVVGRAAALVPLTSMRCAIAEHMTRARQSTPHGQTVLDADLTRLVAWRDQYKDAFQANEGASLTFTVLFVHAFARALASRQPDPVHLGVAVALDAGLIVPVLHNADSLSLGEIARGVTDLATRARANKLAPEDTQGAQMTLTNVGSFGNLTASPIIPLGQVGILGPGLVERRPLPGPDSGLRLGWRCLLCLMFDRRALNDFAADQLLRSVVHKLEDLGGTSIAVLHEPP